MFDRISEGQWWDKSWSLVEGCTRCSPGCDHCWLKAMDKRFKREIQDEPVSYPMVMPERLDIPLKRRKPTAWAIWSDLFHEYVGSAFRANAVDVIRKCPQHVFLVLTKRSREMFEWFGHAGVQPLPSNLWAGVTVCNQSEADEKIPQLLRVPAAVRFLSIEPMLGPVDLSYVRTRSGWLNPLRGFSQYVSSGQPVIDWVILGGESGPGARPMNPEWVRYVRDQCLDASIPFFFKQNGEWVSVSEVEGAGNHYHFPGGATVRRVGKKAAGKTLDGQEYLQVPQRT